MGGGTSTPNNTFDIFRRSFSGHFVSFSDTKGLLEKCTKQSYPTLSVIKPPQVKLFLVLDGSVDICVIPAEKRKELVHGSGQGYEAVQVAALLNSCRTLRPGDMYQFFGSENPEIVCASSAQTPAKLLCLSEENFKHLITIPVYEKLAKFGDMDVSGLLQKVPMFKDMGSRELNILGALLNIQRIDSGQAVTQRGRAGDDSGMCAIFLDGQLVEVSNSSNYLYPLSEHSLHKLDESAKSAVRKPRRGSTIVKTTVAELELEDTCAITNGFQHLWVGDVIGANLCFYPGMGASSTVAAREKSLIGLLTRDALFKLEKVLSVPLESRLRQAAAVHMLKDMKQTNVLMRVISNAELVKLAAGCTMTILAPGESLIKEHEEVHSFYSLVGGNLTHTCSLDAVAGSVKAKGEIPSSPRAESYSAHTSDQVGCDKRYPFSFYSPEAHHIPVHAPATNTITANDGNPPVIHGPKHPVLSATRKFMFPLASAIATMSAFHSLSAVVPRGSSTKYGDASKTAILCIPQRVIDEAVFQASFEKSSSEQICRAVDDVDFIHVLRHHAGFNHLHEYLKNERSTEGIYFWKAVERFEILMGRFQLPTPVKLPEDSDIDDVCSYASMELKSRLMAAHEITLTIIEQYVDNDSFFQVNIPHTLRSGIHVTFGELVVTTTKLLADVDALKASKTQDQIESLVAECNAIFQAYGSLFVKAKQEVYLLMREDSYKRWRRTEGFSHFIMDSLKKGTSAV